MGSAVCSHFLEFCVLFFFLIIIFFDGLMGSWCYFYFRGINFSNLDNYVGNVYHIFEKVCQNPFISQSRKKPKEIGWYDHNTLHWIGTVWKLNASLLLYANFFLVGNSYIIGTNLQCFFVLYTKSELLVFHEGVLPSYSLLNSISNLIHTSFYY